MKYIAASLLVAGAAAQSFDASTAINNLITSVNGLKSDVDAYTSGPGQSLISASNSLISELKSDDTAVKAAPAFSNDQALALATPVQNLGTAVKAAVDSFVGKKQAFVSSGEGSVAYSAISAQASAANAFSTDLIAKVPSGLSQIASNLAAPISSALASGVSAFADVASASGGASTASSAASSGASSVASTSASATSGAASTTASASASSNGTVTSATPSVPVHTGGANSAVVGSGVAGLALLAALAL